MNFLKLVLVTLQVFILIQANANSNVFNEKFQLIKDENGKVVEIRDASLMTKFSIVPYVDYIVDAIEMEQQRMLDKGIYELEIEQMLVDHLSEKSDQNSENVERTILSLRQLKKLKVREIVENKKVKEFLEKFELKLGEVLASFNPTVVARLDNPSFFYQRNVTYQVVSWALDLAKKSFSSVPVLGTISFIVKEVEEMIVKRRNFHQNMLLHYFDHMSENELGMTKEEVDRAYSSIYESKIPWFAFWESKAAKSDWENYGVNKYFAQFRQGTSSYRKHKRKYDEVGERVNFAFYEVVYKGDPVIINLFNKHSMINSMPAISYNYNAPDKVKRLRTVLQIAQLGLSFTKFPQGIKNVATNFMKSYYEEQSITEGSLFAHFELVGDSQMKNQIVRQLVNPYEISL